MRARRDDDGPEDVDSALRLDFRGFSAAAPFIGALGVRVPGDHHYLKVPGKVQQY